MTGTLRDRLAAILGPGNDDTTAYAQADAVLEVLAHETQQHGICGARGPQTFDSYDAMPRWQCQLRAGHDGLHEDVIWPMADPACPGALLRAEHVHWEDQP